VVYSTNITPDTNTGIGQWTAAEFRAALKDGKGHAGRRLYPAMPYPYYTRMPDDEVEAIRAYLMTVAPVHAEAPANTLPFPFNIRLLMKVWNALNFRRGEFQPEPGQSEAWNRGAYIVTGPGHCGACHTPKTALGGDRRGQALKGGEVEFEHAPNLTGEPRTGFSRWSSDDIVTYLRTGANRHTEANGAMQDVVDYSTSKLSDEDLHAIAVYLKTLPGAPPNR